MNTTASTLNSPRSTLLTGRRAIVTGGSNPRGIGYAIAHALQQAGATVISLDVAPASTTTPWTSLLCDVAKEDDCRQAVHSATATLGGLDLLINNAGIVGAAPLDQISDSEFRQMLEINLLGAVHMTQAALVALKQSAQESPQLSPGIVNIASMAAYRGGGLLGSAHYATSKGGLISFTRACARELGPAGIRANAIAPGIIETDVTIGKFGDDWEQQLKSTIPSGRFGAPAEVAQVVVFLASAMASYVNGAVIDVNGGIYMH